MFITVPIGNYWFLLENREAAMLSDFTTNGLKGGPEGGTRAEAMLSPKLKGCVICFETQLVWLYIVRFRV